MDNFPSGINKVLILSCLIVRAQRLVVFILQASAHTVVSVILQGLYQRWNFPDQGFFNIKSSENKNRQTARRR